MAAFLCLPARAFKSYGDTLLHRTLPFRLTSSTQSEQHWLQHTGIEFTAIVDPNIELANLRVSEYSHGPNAGKWKHVQVFQSHQAMLDSEVRVPFLFLLTLSSSTLPLSLTQPIGQV